MAYAQVRSRETLPFALLIPTRLALRQTPHRVFPQFTAFLAKQRADRHTWPGFVARLNDDIALIDLLTEDPLTHWLRYHGTEDGAWREAELMYCTRAGREDASDLGQAIFDQVTLGGIGMAMRGRETLFKAAVDNVSHRKPDARILTVGADALATAAAAHFAQRNEVREIMALDLGPGDGTPPPAPRTFFRSKRLSDWRNVAVEAGCRDLVFVHGVVGTLDDMEATRLIATLAGSLAPGGKLLIAEINADAAETAYREALMGVYARMRSSRRLEKLAPIAPRFQSTAVDLGALAVLTVERLESL